MGQTHYLNDWEAWKELCEFYNFDPYEGVELSVDEGGGNSSDFEYIGDIPEKEDEK